MFVNCVSRKKREQVTVKRTLDAEEIWEAVWYVGDLGGYSDIAYANGAAYVFYERSIGDAGDVSELVLKKAIMPGIQPLAKHCRKTMIRNEAEGYAEI